jgi:phage shock protein A
LATPRALHASPHNLLDLAWQMAQSLRSMEAELAAVRDECAQLRGRVMRLETWVGE